MVSIEKFDEKEKLIEDQIKIAIDTFKDIIQIEIDFISKVNDEDSIYSPVKDRWEKLSENVRDTSMKSQVKLNQEMTKLSNIHKKLNDTNIKAAMFGDVSAGKSQTINSILGRKIFIPAYCHTTICFVNINMTDDKETVRMPNGEEIICENDDEMRSRVKDFANFNGQNKLKPNEVLQIKVTKREKDVIMRKNLTLIDCPGGNETPEVTKMIETVVVEADIFLYIITQVIFEQQRAFFKQLLTKTSAPNVFVLVNKWDETDNDEPMDTARAFDSLKSEISTWLTKMDTENKDLCENRIFFISAKETLQAKTAASSEPPTDQRKKRLDEFARFEQIFAEHLDNPKEIKVVKHIKEFDKMEKNVGDIKQQNARELDNLRERRAEDVSLIKKKMEKLESARSHLCKDTEDKIGNIELVNFDKFSKDQLKMIEKELEKFTDMPEKPSLWERFSYGTIKNAWSFTKAFVGMEKKTEPKEIIQESTLESMINHINREVDIIKVALQKELLFYENYMAKLPKKV